MNFDKTQVQTRLAKAVSDVLENPSCAFSDGEVIVMLGNTTFRNKPAKKKKDE